MQYKEVSQTLAVPANTGVKGFLKAIEDILQLPRVQGLQVDGAGHVTYRRYVQEGESSEPIAVDFESLMPYSLIRNHPVRELPVVWEKGAAVAVAGLFDAATRDHLNPVALVGGTLSHFWPWYAQTVFSVSSTEELYGVPFLTDRWIEDHVLILCASYSRLGALIDTQRSYKIVLPIPEAP